MRRRYNDAVLKIQSALNNLTNTESVREVKEDVYLLLSGSSRSHNDSKLLIKQYYKKAIAEYGSENFLKNVEFLMKNQLVRYWHYLVCIMKKNI